MGGAPTPQNVSNVVYKSLASHGRQVIRHKLPADCLLHDQVHPNIRERLERIRQIPHPGIASLVSLERDDSGGVWLVWNLVEGESFVDAASDPRRSIRDVAALMRELALSVESFHAAGLVHGALSDPVNVLVDRDGRIRLTGVSPLLYHDPAVDEGAVVEIFRGIIARRGETDTPLGQLIARESSLRALRMALAALVESPDSTPEPLIAARSDSRIRKGALIAAVLVAFLGAAIAVGLYARIRNLMPKPLSPPVLQEPGS